MGLGSFGRRAGRMSDGGRVGGDCPKMGLGSFGTRLVRGPGPGSPWRSGPGDGCAGPEACATLDKMTKRSQFVVEGSGAQARIPAKFGSWGRLRTDKVPAPLSSGFIHQE